jgi:hypothetical protein
MADGLGTYPYFRLNLEQQGKRAKELLKAARSGSVEALARFRSHPPKLAEAQFLIARELRFDNWAALKAHIAIMSRERERMESTASRNIARPGTQALDADARTLHIRCGSDLQKPLQVAGFHGDFYEHSYPYIIGPVREGPGAIEERAKFLAIRHEHDHGPPLTYAGLFDSLSRDEQRLHDSADYERVVIWSEFDVYDQLVLLRLLGHYAAHRRPPRIELVNVGAFPGAVRFIGLGQLPPEALRLLWTQREPVTIAQLSLGLAGWKALASSDPRALAVLMRSGTPQLPLLAPALHRHLRELPALENGLGFTQQMSLALLAEQPRSLFKLFGRLNYFVDPLPGQGDSQMLERVTPLGAVSMPLFSRAAGFDLDGRVRPPWTDVLTLTEAGRAVLRGELDFLSLQPPSRWVGGVPIGAAHPDWRWDEALHDAVLRR